MRRSAKVAAAAFLTFGAAGAAGAQTVALEQICPASASGTRVFSPAGLMMAALDAGTPSRRALDLDGDGNETQAERLQVVLLNPCSAAGSRCEADGSKIVAVQSALFATFGRQDLSITRKRGPATSAEIAQEPWLATRAEPGTVGSVAELLDPRGRFLSVDCKGPPPATTASSTPPAEGGAPRRARLALRVTSKLEELSREAGQDITTVDAATLSIANDHVGDKLTFAIDGFVGVSVPLGVNDTLIPFVQYQRTSVRDRSVTPANTSRSPDKLGIGAVVGLSLGRYDAVDLAPVYVVDYEKGSRVLSLKANWVPGFLRQIDPLPVMRSRPLVRGLLFYGLAPRVLVQGSHVFDAGSNAELLTASDYLRLGGDVSLDLWGDGPLRDFTASVAYKRLFRLTTGPRDVDLLKATLQYWLDSGQHVSLGYTYERGLDEDTTTRVDDWKLSLGVRF